MDSAAFSSLTTESAREWILPGMRFARKQLVPVVPAVRSAWRRTALPKEKVGAVTARRLPHPFHKNLASMMVHAEGPQDLLMVNVPVVGNKLSHPLAFSRPSVRTRLMARMEFEDFVETGAGGEATALQMVQMRSQLVQALMLMLALAVKSVLTQLAPRKGTNGAASVGRKHPCCLKALVSLMIPVLELQTALMKTPLVPAAIQNTFLHATKQRNVGKPSLRLV